MNSFYSIGIITSHPEELEISQVELTEKGLFFYQEHQLVLYIKDTRKRTKILKQNPEQANRFHLTNCTTIGDIKKPWVKQRFVATARTDGLFYVYGLADNGELIELLAKLKVCRSCLFKLNYKTYCTSDKLVQEFIVESFDIKRFFEECQPHCDHIKPLNSATSMPFDRPWKANFLLVRLYFVNILLRQFSQFLLSATCKSFFEK